MRNTTFLTELQALLKTIIPDVLSYLLKFLLQYQTNAENLREK